MRSNHEYEERVLHFITENKRHLIIPQIELFGAGDSTTEFSPDFIAIRPEHRTVFVVEVTVADSMEKLANKFNAELLRRVQAELTSAGMIGDGWQLHFAAFVKSERIKTLNRELDRRKRIDLNLVHLWPIEATFAHWLWKPELRSEAFDLAKPEQVGSYLRDSGCIRWSFTPETT